MSTKNEAKNALLQLVDKAVADRIKALPANDNREVIKTSGVPAGKAYAPTLLKAVHEGAPTVLKTYTPGTGTGGEFAPAITLEAFIGILAEEAIVVKAGADTTARGYGTSVQIPRLDSVGDGKWLAPGSAGTAETGATSFVTLNAQRYQIRDKISDRVLNQPGNMMLEGATDSFLRRLAEQVDHAFINGAASPDTANGPGGIIPGMAAGQAVAAVAADDVATVEELRSMLLNTLKRVRSAKVQFNDSTAWVMNSNEYYALQSRLDAVGNRAFPTLEDSGTLFGRPVYQSENCPVGTVLFGRFDMVAVGVAEPAQFQAAKLGDDAVADVTSIWARYLGDCKLRHSKAFASITGLDAVL